MVDILPAKSDCLHVGWALWRDHWQWWCGRCGITVSEFDIINEVDGHQPGDLWGDNETA